LSYQVAQTISNNQAQFEHNHEYSTCCFIYIHKQHIC